MLTRRYRAKIHLSWAVRSSREWLLRWIYAQHNARVIIDFEHRMSMVIYAATAGMMSKPYYTTEAMLAEMRDAEERAYNAAYAEGRADALNEAEIAPAEPGVLACLPCPCGEPSCVSPVPAT